MLLPAMFAARAAHLLRIRLTDPERWADLNHPGGWSAQGLSKLDALYWNWVALVTVHYVVKNLFRTSDMTQQTARNTREMRAVVAQMQESSAQSLAVLAAMREEADAARRETAAAQRLALWVGVGTAVVGALLGAVAGAFAAHVISG